MSMVLPQKVSCQWKRAQCTSLPVILAFWNIKKIINTLEARQPLALCYHKHQHIFLSPANRKKEQKLPYKRYA